MSIEIKNLNYFYNDNLINSYQALKNINLTIKEGDIVSIAGATGAGKSTLAEIIAGLLPPTNGNIFIDDVDIYNKKEKTITQRAKQKIGMVFQYSDYQLFEETVEKDIAFAPKEMGFSNETVKEKVERAMNLVGLSKDMKNSVPYNLSGGEKKRVAIAGILAFSPKYLILDEPTVGLDACYRDQILNLILNLNKIENMTIIFISHNMDIIAEIADKIIVMKDGEVLKYDTAYNIFNNEILLKEAKLKRPQISLFLDKLKIAGFNVRNDIIKFNEGVKNIIGAIR